MKLCKCTMHAAYTLQMTGFCLHWHLQATQSSRPTVIVFLPHIQHICIDMSGEHEKCTCSLVPQQPYSSKAPPAVYIPEDSWPANQNCKLSHTLGGKSSYTTLSQPYTPCGQPYTTLSHMGCRLCQNLCISPGIIQ